MAVQQGVLHRDISGGNLLIYPTVQSAVDPESKEEIRSLQWVGILTDWELSKGVDAPSGARQPERTVCCPISSLLTAAYTNSLIQGTWQYMSVALLRDPHKIVERADDLESFTHIIIYNAVRYLGSDCANVGDWIEDFFDSYCLDSNGMYTCGDLKLLTVTETAKLMAQGKELRFKSPMDALLKSLLTSLKAYYAVKAYDTKAKLLPESTPATTTPTVAPSEPVLKLNEAAIFSPFELTTTTKLDSDSDLDQDTAESAPSEADRETAERVTSHQGLCGLLMAAMRSTQWKHDKVEDRVPIDWQPKRAIGPSVVSTVARNKRRRLQEGSQHGVMSSAESPAPSSSSSLMRAPSKVSSMQLKKSPRTTEPTPTQTIVTPPSQ